MIGFNSLLGSPWHHTNAASTIDARNFNYTLLGSPWWGPGAVAAPAAGHIKRICGIGRDNIKKIGGIAVAHVKAAGGVID